MREIMPEIERWRQAGKQVAVATIVNVKGSALRRLGAKMACTPSGEIAGSVSGGCVEGAVYDEAQDAIQTGRPRLLEYGIANEEAWEIGLACGGTIQVWVEALDDNLYAILRDNLNAGRLIASATIVAGQGLGGKLLVWPDGRTAGDLGSDELTEKVIRYTLGQLSSQNPGRATIPLANGSAELFVDVFPPLPRLVIVGAAHIAIPLVGYAKILGFHTVLVDARSAFATRERFPDADEIIVDWPSTVLSGLNLDEGAYVAIVTHDDKLDIPAIQAALASTARYIGVLGSVTTHAKRIQSLKELGISDKQLERIHAPVGLPLGATSAEEIALAIMAEIVAVRHGCDQSLPSMSVKPSMAR
jgi:xanthine dehydrogenase accessory factor